ncbi:MAG: hypothetical protein M1830_005438, partial [Pleopsidium flavum]
FPPERPQNPPPKPSSNSSPWIWDPQRKVYYQQQPYQAQYPMSQGYEMPPQVSSSSSYSNDSSVSATQDHYGQQHVNTSSGTAGQVSAAYQYSYDQSPYYAGSASQQQVSNPERGYQGVSQNQSQGPSTSYPYAYSYPGSSGVGGWKKETKK